MQSYQELPSVLIQDPLSECAYLIGADRLREHEMSPDKLVYVDEGVITFSIPEDEFVEPTPPFNATRTSTPAVIVQFEAGQTSYFLTYNELQDYRVDQPSEYGGYGISFVIPVANEFLEKLSCHHSLCLESGGHFRFAPLSQVRQPCLRTRQYPKHANELYMHVLQEQ